jgi:hypothetical protein
MIINDIDNFDDDELKASVSELDGDTDASIKFVVRYDLSANRKNKKN